MKSEVLATPKNDQKFPVTSSDKVGKPTVLGILS